MSQLLVRQALETERLVHQLCEEFETEHRHGKQPDWVSYVRRISPAGREALLWELAPLDWELRSQSGDTVNIAEYTQRLPEHAEVLEEALAEVSLSAQGGSPAKALSGKTPQPPAERYRLLGEPIACGGMGEVYRAWDCELNRELAVKILYRDHPQAVRRFRQEAHINGRLQHPGVAPIHETGKLADGRFFIAMKLVRGRTLADWLENRQEDDLPRLLNAFTQVCQTLAYAHSEGVLHRDLKPANIMVGAFGEVQVMDWGLAKIQHEEGETPGEPTPHWETPLAQTEFGALLGTLAYMSPEQARGDVENLDLRTDVFGLGAILCEILTDAPPHRSRNREQLKQLAAAGDLSDARQRLLDSPTDRDLQALALRCLESDPDLRPADAAEVAQAMNRYLENLTERLRQVELEQLEARTRAVEQRKRRRLWGGLAVAAVLLATTWIGARWRLALAKNKVAADAIVQVEHLAQQRSGDSDNFVQTLQLASQAAANIENDALQKRLRAMNQTGRTLQRLEQALHDLVSFSSTQDSKSAVEVVETLQEILKSYELWPLQDVAKALEKWRLAPPIVRRPLRLALDRWVEFGPTLPSSLRAPSEISLLLTETETDHETQRLRQDPQYAEQVWRDMLEGSQQTYSSNTLLWMHRKALRDKNGELAVRALEQACEQKPGDYWLRLILGKLLASKGDNESRRNALRHLEAACALRPNNAGAWLDIGCVEYRLGNHPKAERCFRKAVQLNPNDLLARTNWSDALVRIGNTEEAKKQLQMVTSRESDSYRARYLYGVLLRWEGDLPGATRAQQLVLRKAPKFTPALYELVLIYEKQQKLVLAIQHCEEVIRREPDHQKWKAFEKLGDLALKRMLETGSEKDRRRATEVFRRIQQQLPAGHLLVQKANAVLQKLGSPPIPALHDQASTRP